MAILDDIPGAAQMLTVPGVGAVTVVGFLEEVGDLTGYDHEQQIIRLAGLYLKKTVRANARARRGSANEAVRD